MKRPCFCAFIALAGSAALAQNAYLRCVDECINAGGDPATCRDEVCNPAEPSLTSSREKETRSIFPAMSFGARRR
jgi:hypothetical protein